MLLADLLELLSHLTYQEGSHLKVSINGLKRFQNKAELKHLQLLLETNQIEINSNYAIYSSTTIPITIIIISKQLNLLYYESREVSE